MRPDGVEFPSFPTSLGETADGDERVIVVDMSSNFLSRRVDVSKYGVIFGGKQSCALDVSFASIVPVRDAPLRPIGSSNIFQRLKLSI